MSASRGPSVRSWRMLLAALTFSLAVATGGGLISCTGATGGQNGAALSQIQVQAERAATATVVTAKRAYVEVISTAAKANEDGVISTDQYARVLEAGWQVYPALLAADEALKAYFRLATSERDPAALVAILVDLQMAYNKFREAAKAEGVN